MLLNDTHLKNYLAETDASKRCVQLQKFAAEGTWFPLSLLEDLLSLDLDRNEQMALLGVADRSDTIALEDFLTSGVRRWGQDVASIAMREWVDKTTCLLWHRTIPLSKDPHIPQRLSFTMLDVAWHGAGDDIIHTFCRLDGVEGMSAAFHALLLLRALQWQVGNPILRKIADKHLGDLKAVPFSEDKAVPYALAYMARFHPEVVPETARDIPTRGVWRDLVKAIGNVDFDAKTQKCLAVALEEESDFLHQNVQDLWPELWHRHRLSPQIVAKALRSAAARATDQKLWECFGGIGRETLIKSLDFAAPTELPHWLKLLGALIGEANRAAMIARLGDALQAAGPSPEFLGSIPEQYRLYFVEPGQEPPVIKAIKAERDHVLKHVQQKHETTFTDLRRLSQDRNPIPVTERSRKSFFQVAFRGETVSVTNDSSFWGLLTQAWQTQKESLLEPMAAAARQEPHLYKVCYIKTLGQFKGLDKAALKLLDFIRSPSQDILVAVAKALGGIGTGRAHQELVAFLTRSNMSVPVKLEVAQILKGADLTLLQSELRSAIQDLNINPNTENVIWELREAITGLLQIPKTGDSISPETIVAKGAVEHGPTAEELDQMLERRIVEFNRLSGEAKRALRTAQFFHLQVEANPNVPTIDLSPAIDMQYKALELTYRELFEDACSQLIQRGILQRKLDVIGYARPIMQAMDEFEQFIENLPGINSIPFFSRFKLRKMLRAICQFRPGKRFTLDGLKAFALFFICFSRKTCPYGLADQFPLKDFDDKELAEFVRCLHIFQDFRNRAAHEGFHPDASNDIEGIWTETAKIIKYGLRIKDQMTPAASVITTKRQAS